MLQGRSTTKSRLGWLFAALLMFLPATAKADTLSAEQYQNNLQRAITVLKVLQLTDESESPYYYQNQLDSAVVTIREALPEKQLVQSSDEVCEVDNSWVHASLEDLKASSVGHRPAKLTLLLERLRAIEERVAYERRLATPADSKAHTKEKLESILARPEYATEARGRNALSRLLEDAFRWLQQFLPAPVRVAPGRASWMSVVAQVLVVVVAALVLFYVFRILLTRLRGTRRRRASRKSKARIVLGERLEPEDTAVDLLAEAEALARRGDLRAAIRKAYIALLVELGDRKVITLAQHKTNRDYLNAVRNIPVLHSTMRGLTDTFERHWYGFAEATENDWRNFRSRYQAAVQTQN